MHYTAEFLYPKFFFWNHRFLVRGWYQVSWARSSKHWVESRSCQNSIFYFSPLPIKTPFKGMKTVNKFISIDIIFVQTAFNWANTCVYTIYWVDTFKPILATSRVILELNPFGILIRGTILTGRPMVPCVLKNSKKSTVQCVKLPSRNEYTLKNHMREAWNKTSGRNH